jgi:uncharacterized protein YdeI (YjbR/CyaY-like superfamily)
VHSASEFESWLRTASDEPGVWVVHPKRSSNLDGPSYDELVLVALRFGWVDSVPGKVDQNYTKLYFAPRKPGSGWALTNKRRIEHLEAHGLMEPAGIKVVERARADGSWSRIDGSETLTIPSDLEATFDEYHGSREQFAAFPPGIRKQILQWIELARTEQTRRKRLTETASLAAQGIRANQWRDKKGK